MFITIKPEKKDNNISGDQAVKGFQKNLIKYVQDGMGSILTPCTILCKMLLNR